MKSLLFFPLLFLGGWGKRDEVEDLSRSLLVKNLGKLGKSLSPRTRKAMVGMFMPKATELYPTLMPTLMPQISDPRIIIQTFNAPNAPILPSVLPKPKVDLNVVLPKQHIAPKPDIIILDQESKNEKLEREAERRAQKILEKNLLRAMKRNVGFNRKYRNRKGVDVDIGHIKEKNKLNVMATLGQRFLHSVEARNKVKRIELKMSELSNSYRFFKRRLASKMKALGFLLAKWKQKNVSVIV